MLVTFSHILNILLKIDLILNLNLFIQITEEIMHNLFFISCRYTIAPHTTQQNGVSEYCHHHIVEIGISFLIDTSLSSTY